MYWTDVRTDRIERATMDGNSRTVLHSTGLSNAYGLTLDYDNQILYWVDYSYRRIESSSVDGSNRTVIISHRYPWAVTFYDGVLYWTDTTYRRIYSYSVSTTPSSVQTVIYIGSNPYDIRVLSEERQPLGLYAVNWLATCDDSCHHYPLQLQILVIEETVDLCAC